MAIVQSMGNHIKSLFCLLHWILLVSVFAEKGGLDNIYIRLALLAFPFVMCEEVLRRAQIAVKSLIHLILWVLWVVVLAGKHDLGCSYLRLALLALPFFKSKRAIKSAQKAVKCMWRLLVWLIKRTRYFLSVVACIPWMALNLVFPLPSVLLLVQILLMFMQSAFVIFPWILWIHMLMDGFEVPILLCEAVFQILKTTVKQAWLLCSAVRLTSVEEYIDDGHPVTILHDILQFRICSQDGQNLWKGFIDVVLNAYDNHRSWAGSFNSDHLRMRGSKCIIEMQANYPATYENLLLDLGKLASLLMPHFETINQVAPGYIQELYSSMTAPLLVSNPPPTPQELQSFVRFMRHHPGLRSARLTNIFLRKVFEACKGMEQAGSDAVDQAVDKVRMLQADWRNMVQRSGHPLLNRTLRYKAGPKNNTRYHVGARQLFRFIRNLLTHGADRDANGQPTVNDMEELDLIIAEFFCQPITDLVYYLVMDIEMTGMLKHAWAEFL